MDVMELRHQFTIFFCVRFDGVHDMYVRTLGYFYNKKKT